MHFVARGRMASKGRLRFQTLSASSTITPQGTVDLPIFIPFLSYILFIERVRFVLSKVFVVKHKVALGPLKKKELY